MAVTGLKRNLQKLQKERCLILAEYHKAAERLDNLDYRIHQLKKAVREKEQEHEPVR